MTLRTFQYELISLWCLSFLDQNCCNLLLPVILQEKRKTRKALEMKKVLEAKLEASEERCRGLSSFRLFSC